MQLAQKYIDFKIDKKSFHPDGVSSRIIRAYASTWDVDTAGDKIERGAFLRSIKNRFTLPMLNKGKSDIRFLFQHDPKECIGTIKAIHEDERGLYVECYISRTKRGDDLLILLKDGAIDKMSIGYIPIEVEEAGDIRVLKEVDIFEVSVVVFPMNEATDIFEVRSRDMTKVLAKLAKKQEATLLDFELKELAYRAEQINAEIKAGKVLSGAHKKKLLSALSNIHEVLCAALPYDSGEEAKGEDISTCSECGMDEKNCKCESCAKEIDDEAKSSDSSAPNKEGVVDPIRTQNPSNPQTSPESKGDPVGEDLDFEASFKEDESSETYQKTSSEAKEITQGQNNTVGNIDLAGYLRSIADSISRIK